MKRQKLMTAMVLAGETVESIGLKMNIDRSAVYDKLRGVEDFTLSEAGKIKAILHLSAEQYADIFLF